MKERSIDIKISDTDIIDSKIFQIYPILNQPAKNYPDINNKVSPLKSVTEYYVNLIVLGFN